MLLVPHEVSTIKMCVSPEPENGNVMPVLLCLLGFQEGYESSDQVAYSLGSQPVAFSDGIDAGSDPTGVSAPVSALLLLPVCVALAAVGPCHQGEHSPSAAFSPLSQSGCSRGSWCCGWHGSQLLAQGQGASGTPQTPRSTIHSKGQWP